MKRPNLSLLLYLLVVFFSGVVVGVVAQRVYDAKTVSAKMTPDEYRRRYLQEMRSRLKLSEEQARQVNSIFDATKASFRELRQKYRPEVKAIQDEQVRRIESVLNETQRLEYNKMREEREQQRKKEQERQNRS